MRTVKRSPGILTPLLLVSLIGASPARATEPVNPWGQVLYGMTLPQLQELYPELVGSSWNEEAGKRQVLPYQHFWLGKQQFGPLEGCTVEFMLLKQTLARMNFYCVHYHKGQVRAALEERYGFPVEEGDLEVVWLEGGTRIGMNQNSGYFGLGDAARAEQDVLSVLGPALNRLRAEAQAEQSDSGESDSASPDEAPTDSEEDGARE